MIQVILIAGRNVITFIFFSLFNGENYKNSFLKNFDYMKQVIKN